MNVSARIMPREKGTLSLDIVIAAMAFLAAVALGAALIAQRAAVSWRTGLTGRITVQILPPEKGRTPLEAQMEAALSLLRNTNGIAHAAPVSERDTLALVEPWLGSGAAVDALPLPRLIDATLTPGVFVDMNALRRRLKAVAPDSMLDDHTRWISRFRSLAQGIVWSAYFVLALIAVATAASVSFATRAGLQAHREIVELLHQMGARPGFIARAFEWHYFLAALIAGLLGAGLAAALYVLSGGLESLGIQAAPFLPPLTLRLDELAWLLLVPVAASWIALGTARLSVLRALSRIY